MMMRKTLLLFGVTITTMVCMAFLVAMDRIAPLLGYGVIIFLSALWLPSPLHSQDAWEYATISAHLSPLIPEDRAEGVYPISEVRDVAVK